MAFETFAGHYPSGVTKVTTRETPTSELDKPTFYPSGTGARSGGGGYGYSTYEEALKSQQAQQDLARRQAEEQRQNELAKKEATIQIQLRYKRNLRSIGGLSERQQAINQMRRQIEAKQREFDEARQTLHPKIPTRKELSSRNLMKQVANKIQQQKLNVLREQLQQEENLFLKQVAPLKSEIAQEQREINRLQKIKDSSKWLFTPYAKNLPKNIRTTALKLEREYTPSIKKLVSDYFGNSSNSNILSSSNFVFGKPKKNVRRNNQIIDWFS